MKSFSLRHLGISLGSLMLLGTMGCAHHCGTLNCETNACTVPETCGDSCSTDCNTGCSSGCGSLSWHDKLCSHLAGKFRSNAIPETLPLGSTVRAHRQVMETNAEASDFILHDHDFVGETAELTPLGKDKIMEIGARMRSTPFPVLVERGVNNSNPELDAHRRNLVAQILTDFGNFDADQRTIVAPAYSLGYNSFQAEGNYYQYLSTGGNGNFGNNGFGNGGGGGFGGSF